VKLSYNENKEFQNLEKEISKLGAERIQLENQFVNNEIESDAINEASQKLQEIISTIEAKEERWLELSMKLED